MSGVDPLRLFPNSRMAQAVRLGLSRFVSTDQPAALISEVNNVDVSGVYALVPPTGGDNGNATYATITAVGGTAYITFDGTVPTAVNYAVALAAGATVPLYGKVLSQTKIWGASASIAYMS